MVDKIRALVVRPGEDAKVEMVDNKYMFYHNLVGGCIECVYLHDGAILVCNDEGKLINLEPNRRLFDDVICGNFVVVGDNKQGDFASLNDKQLKNWLKYFKEPQNISKEDVKVEFKFYSF